jgi:hypothetical protein
MARRTRANNAIRTRTRRTREETVNASNSNRDLCPILSRSLSHADKGDTDVISTKLCQLSALLGLNHWHLHHADKVEVLVDEFLQKTKGLTPRVIGYAAEARSGCAL